MDPDIVKEELVTFKMIYELMEENIDISDLLPGSDKKYKEKEGKDGESFPDGNRKDEGEKIEKQKEETERKRKERAEVFIIKGF